MKNDALAGMRVAVLVADGFEQIEVTWPLRRLRRAGADVRVLSLRPGRVRGVNFLWRGRKLPVDDTVGRARPDDYGALLLPGGFVSPDLLRQNPEARAFVQRMVELDRPIATICHGPELLISAGLVHGRRLASWPGIADDVRNAGGTWVDEAVVEDRRWVSSRGPHDIRAFTDAAIALFARHGVPAMSPLPRRVRWAAQLSRAATAAAVVGAVVGGQAGWRRLARRSPARHAGLTAADAVRDIGLAAAFGGMLFAKLALDPAVRNVSRAQERGSVVLSSWRRFAVPSGVGLMLATAGWIAGRRRFRSRPSLTRSIDLLLGGAVATGTANVVCAELLARRSAGAGVPLDTGNRAAPGASRGEAALVRTGAVTGLVHAGALAAVIGATAALRTP